MVNESSIQIPLIAADEPNDTHVNKALQRLETFLRIFGFCQYSPLSITLSWLSFLLLGVVLPILIIQLSYCSNCQKYQIKTFELQIVIFGAIVAAISILCISHNLRKYGVRKFLFVDRCHGHTTQFRDQYIQKINVSSVVLLVGIIIFLQAAARISRRAQGLASVASRWHALVTCNTNEASEGIPNNSGNESSNSVGSLHVNYSESDLDSVDYVPTPTNIQLASHMSVYQKRQAFVTYLRCNPGGATVFGWTVDRGLINTVFFIELSLVLFVLGKTITFTTT